MASDQRALAFAWWPHNSSEEKPLKGGVEKPLADSSAEKPLERPLAESGVEMPLAGSGEVTPLESNKVTLLEAWSSQGA